MQTNEYNKIECSSCNMQSYSVEPCTEDEAEESYIDNGWDFTFSLRPLCPLCHINRLKSEIAELKFQLRNAYLAIDKEE